MSASDMIVIIDFTANISQQFLFVLVYMAFKKLEINSLCNKYIWFFFLNYLQYIFSRRTCNFYGHQLDDKNSLVTEWMFFLMCWMPNMKFIPLSLLAFIHPTFLLSTMHSNFISLELEMNSNETRKSLPFHSVYSGDLKNARLSRFEDFVILSYAEKVWNNSLDLFYCY